MKKLVIVFLVMLVIGCGKHNSTNMTEPHRLLERIVKNYEKTDSPYWYYGCYKEIIYKYNYQYRDSTSRSFRYIDTNFGGTYFINEYGDTVRIIYTDYRDYPRREE